MDRSSAGDALFIGGHRFLERRSGPSFGTQTWNRTLNDVVHLRDLQTLPSGDVLVAGGKDAAAGLCATDRAWLGRFDPGTGADLTGWPRTYTTSDLRVLASLTVATSGDYHLLGQSCILSPTTTAGTYWLKTNGDGDPIGDPLLIGGGLVQYGVMGAPIASIMFPVLFNSEFQAPGARFVATSDGGAIAALTAAWAINISGAIPNSDIVLTKLSSSGAVEWETILGGVGHEEAAAVVVTADDDYLVVGTTAFDFYGSRQIYLVRVNSAGEVLWYRTHGVEGSGGLQPTSALAVADGFVIVGSTAAFGLQEANAFAAYALKVDHSGRPVWQKLYGPAPGLSPEFDAAGFYTVISTSATEIVAGGYRGSDDGGMFGLIPYPYLQRISIATGEPL
jgi:hypothetical protein